tara:strand:- start:4113 stop:4268 length:156 start_codon:yes stop_codon:yes gene_type:complete
MDKYYTDDSNDRPYSLKFKESPNSEKEEKEEKIRSHDYNYWVDKYKNLPQN